MSNSVGQSFMYPLKTLKRYMKLEAKLFSVSGTLLATRIHSSRGDICPGWGFLSGGVSAQGGVSARVSLPREVYTFPPTVVDR